MHTTFRALASAAAAPIAYAATALLVGLASIAPASAIDIRLNTLRGSSFSKPNGGPISIDVELTFSNMDWADDFPGAFSIDGQLLELVDDGFGGFETRVASANLLEVPEASPFTITNFQLGSFFAGLAPAPTVVFGPADLGKSKSLSAPFANCTYDETLTFEAQVASQLANFGQIATFTLIAPAGAPVGSWALDAFLMVGNDNVETSVAASRVLSIAAIPEPGTSALTAGGLALGALGGGRLRGFTA
jgi:hypothetical protein